jgi:tetratricopeptide (TPR) repeat protein
MTPEEAHKTAIRMFVAGDLRGAETIYRQILAQQPANADALHMMGVIASHTGRLDAAVDLIAKAIAIKPGASEFHYNLGLAFGALGRNAEALAAHRKAVELQPDFPEALNCIGECLYKTGDKDGAREQLHKALSLRPNFPEALFNLGNIFAETSRYDAAIEVYRKAIALRPKYAEAYGNLGHALGVRGDFADALAACQASIALRPSVVGYNNLGNVLRELGELDRSIQAYRAALAMNPDDPRSHWNLAISLLLKGDLAEGFDEYEWRWSMREYIVPQRTFAQPRWNLNAPAGKRIFIYAEQGMGDTIQFVRYLPMIIARGGQPILECQPELTRLLQGFAGVKIVERGQPRPEFDLHCPLLSLPKAFGTVLSNIPAKVPYLSPSPQVVNKWQARMPSGAQRKIGLAWAGHPHFSRNHLRSVPLLQMAALAAIPDMQFFSLQKGEAAGQAKQPPTGMELIDWTDDLDDFAETAGLIANLDLVITVDTAVAHLAGAMGKPVWVILGRIPDWRWMMDRADSPWYPTMQLFRQPRLGDWKTPIDEIAAALRDKTAALAR